MTVLSFPAAVHDDAPEAEHAPAVMLLRAEWHRGLASGYRLLSYVMRGPEHFAGVQAPGRNRGRAVAAHTFQAFMRATASRPKLRTLDIARASGFMAAWEDHPKAEQCVNCDLPFVPEVEDGHSRCVDHGPICSAVCRAEVCRVPSCREDD